MNNQNYIIRRSLAQWAKTLLNKVEKMPKPFQQELFDVSQSLETIHSRLLNGSEKLSDYDMDVIRRGVDHYGDTIKHHELIIAEKVDL